MQKRISIYLLGISMAGLLISACSTTAPGGSKDSECKAAGDCAEKACFTAACEAGICKYNPNDVGSSCKAGEADGFCSAGACHNDACLIDGSSLVLSGKFNPANNCEVCDPLKNVNKYSPIVCTTGICVNSECRTDVCNIGGVVYTDGQANPANGCEICDPAVSTSAFSPVSCLSAASNCQEIICDANALVDGQACSGSNCCVTTNKEIGTACVDINNVAGKCDDNGACLNCQDDGDCNDGDCNDGDCNDAFCVSNTCRSDVCKINGAIINDGDAVDGDGCQVCDVAVSKTEITVVSCASDNVCQIAACDKTKLIDDLPCVGGDCCTATNVDNNTSCTEESFNGICKDGFCEIGCSGDGDCPNDKFCDFNAGNNCVEKKDVMEVCGSEVECSAGMACDLTFDTDEQICHTATCSDSCSPLHSNNMCIYVTSASCEYNLSTILPAELIVKLVGDLAYFKFYTTVAPLPVSIDEFASMIGNGIISLMIKSPSGQTVNLINGKYVSGSPSKAGEYTAQLIDNAVVVTFFNKEESTGLTLKVGNEYTASFTVNQNDKYLAAVSFTRNVKVTD